MLLKIRILTNVGINLRILHLVHFCVMIGKNCDRRCHRAGSYEWVLPYPICHLEIGATCRNFKSGFLHTYWPFNGLLSIIIRNIFEGCTLFVYCFMGPKQLIFYCSLRKNFWNFGVDRIFWDLCFSKNLPKCRPILGIFFKNSMISVSKWFRIKTFIRLLSNHLTRPFFKFLKKKIEVFTHKPSKIYFSFHF